MMEDRGEVSGLGAILDLQSSILGRLFSILGFSYTPKEGCLVVKTLDRAPADYDRLTQRGEGFIWGRKHGDSYCWRTF